MARQQQQQQQQAASAAAASAAASAAAAAGQADRQADMTPAALTSKAMMFCLPVKERAILMALSAASAMRCTTSSDQVMQVIK